MPFHMARVSLTPPTSRLGTHVFAAIVLSAMTWTGLAQPQPSPSESVVIAPEISTSTRTLQELRAKITEVENQTDIDESLKNKVLDFYRLAVTRLDTAQQNDARAAAYQQALESAPVRLRQLAEQLDGINTDNVTPQLPAGTTVKGAQQRLAAQRAELTGLRHTLDELEQQLKTQQDRPNTARLQATQAKQKLSEIETELATSSPPTEHRQLADAWLAWLEAGKMARQAEIAMLDQELLSHTTRLELLAAKRHLAAKQLTQAQGQIDRLQTLVNELQRSEAQKALRQAERARLDAAGKHSAVRDLANRNAESSKALANMTAQTEKVIASRVAAERQLARVQQDYKSAQRKLEIAGLTHALGRILHQERKKLPDMRGYRQNTRRRRTQISELGLGEFRIEEERRVLADIDRRLKQIMTKQVDTALPADDRTQIRTQIRRLLVDRRELLDKVASAYSRYLKELGNLDFDEKQLVDRAQQYAAFLDQRLLWIPSASPIGSATFSDMGPALRWFLSPRHWTTAGWTLIGETTRTPLRTTLVALVCLVLLATAGEGRRRLSAIGHRVQSISSDQFSLTIGALLITLLLATPWPLLAGFSAWLLQRSVSGSDFPSAVGGGLAGVAGLVFVFQILRSMCLPNGLAEVHLRWRNQSVRVLRRGLLWLMALALPTTFTVLTFRWYGQEAHRQSLGRFAFMAGMIAFSWFIWQVMRPDGGLPDRFIAMHRRGWLARLRHVWYPAGVGLPLVLAGLAALGYDYTAMELASRLSASVWLAIAVVIAHELVIRWLYVERSKLAMVKARQKRRAAIAAQASQADAQDSGGETPITEFPDVDLAAVNQDTRKMLRVLVTVSLVIGLWVIWAEVVPALGIFDQVRLWRHVVVTDGQETLAHVTLADLMIAVVLAGLITALARHAPSVLEIAVLQHLPMDAGSRYAIRSISRYTITAVGVVVVFTLLGIRWSQIQWLVAALGVGLGFGLQEIVANFVSGLIILFERPIRVGDTVTVGDISGAVSRIQIRATTITDWDRKELIVPNKTFVTDRLVNWTLSDPVTRLIVKVGIAYGSDTELAKKLMLQAAKSNPSVMPDPSPSVFFVGFGDSALDFEARVFVKEVTNHGRSRILHQLHMAIDQTFREHGIVIAFPQRDVHLFHAPTEGASPDAH